MRTFKRTWLPSGPRLVLAMNKLPSQDRLKFWLDYDPATGVFIWRHSPCASVKKGRVAGCSRRGYIFIRVRGYSQIGAHRLAWHTAHAGQHLNGEWFDVEPLNAIVALAQGAAAILEDVFGKEAAAEIIDGLLLKESIARCTQILSRKIASGQVLS